MPPVPSVPWHHAHCASKMRCPAAASVEGRVCAAAHSGKRAANTPRHVRRLRFGFIGRIIAAGAESMVKLLRSVWVWAGLLTLSVVGRDMLDWWLSPTDEFYARSVVSTAVAVGIFAG